MAFSMNWKPDLDEIAKPQQDVRSEAHPGQTDGRMLAMPARGGFLPTRSTGPIPGIFPPGRGPEGPIPPRSDKKNAAPYSFNMNWRPPPVEEEEASPRAIPAPALTSAAMPDSPGQRDFRVSLCTSSLEVTCLDKCGALSCMSPSGMLCCLERITDSRWSVQVHPSRARLSQSQRHDLARVLYACVYAALAVTKQSAAFVQLVHAGLSTNLENALSIFGPPADLSMTITPSVMLQLFALADTRFAGIPAPYVATTSFRGNVQPLSHPLRKPIPQGELYSRWDTSIGDYVVLTGSREKHQLEIIARLKGQRPDAESALTATVDWLLEASGATSGATSQEYDDYDRELRIEAISEKQDDKVQSACLVSLIHYLFIEEPRSRRIVCTIAGKTNAESALKAILAGLGFQHESNVVNKYSLLRNAFWQRITSL